MVQNVGVHHDTVRGDRLKKHKGATLIHFEYDLLIELL